MQVIRSVLTGLFKKAGEVWQSDRLFIKATGNGGGGQRAPGPPIWCCYPTFFLFKHYHITVLFIPSQYQYFTTLRNQNCQHYAALAGRCIVSILQVLWFDHIINFPPNNWDFWYKMFYFSPSVILNRQIYMYLNKTEYCENCLTAVPLYQM